MLLDEVAKQRERRGLTDETALLEAIHRNPEDDFPRLLYADRMEEVGKQDHADYIRAQVRIAQISRIMEKWGEKLPRKKQIELFQERERLKEQPFPPEWQTKTRTILDEDSTIDWERGFATYLATDHHFFQLNAKEVLTAFPTITNLYLSIRSLPDFAAPSAENEEEYLRLFANTPELARIKSMILDRNYHNHKLSVDLQLNIIFNTPHLRGLRKLGLDNDFTFRHQFTQRSAEIIANYPFANLEGLFLTCLIVGDEAATRLARSPNMSALTSLILGGDNSPHSMTDAAAYAIAESPYLKGIRTVYAKGSNITAAGFRALVTNLPELMEVLEIEDRGALSGWWYNWTLSARKHRAEQQEMGDRPP